MDKIVKISSTDKISPKMLSYYRDLSYYEGLAYPLLLKSIRCKAIHDKVASCYIEKELNGWGAIYADPTFTWKTYPILVVYVAPAHRNKGIGTELVQTLLHNWKDTKVIAVVTQTEIHAEENIRKNFLVNGPYVYMIYDL